MRGRRHSGQTAGSAGSSKPSGCGLAGGGGCGTTAAGCCPGEPGVPSGAGGRGGQVRGLAGVEAAGAGHCTAQHESAARIIGGHHLRKGVKGGNV